MVEVADDAAVYSGKQRRRLQRHIATVVGGGWGKGNLKVEGVLEVEGNLGENKGECNLKVKVLGGARVTQALGGSS